jgi:ribosomal protein S18 acetylase RimI-like enzyme
MQPSEELVIRPLSADLLEDYLSFFDHDAFCDNPDWAACYCYFFHVTRHDAAWEARTGEQNRAAISALIAGGRAHGYLAYVAGKPVGWCHAAPRIEIPYLQVVPELHVEDGQRVGAIVCFVIAAPFRRQGIARSLLDAACEGFRQQRLAFAEAYPRLDTHAEDENYPGPLALYSDAGFETFRQLEGALIVRKPL